MNMTPDQLTTLDYRARYNSRRTAKRYCRDHGGTGKADELDSQLKLFAALPDAAERRAANDAQHERAKIAYAKYQAEAAEAEREAKRERLVGMVAAAKAGLKSVVLQLAGDAWMPEWENQVPEWAYKHDSSTPADIVRHLDLDGIDFDDESAAESVICSLRNAAKDAMLESAEKNIEAQQVKDGRYTVIVYYRKTLSSHGSWSFDDLDVAQDCLAIHAEGCAMSSYGVSLIDGEEVLQ